MADRVGGLSLGQLLLALDRTMVTLVDAPRGLDMQVGSVALVDVDDIRLGLAVGAGSADLFFLLGVSDAEAVGWIAHQVDIAGRAPAAIFVKDPSPAAVKQAVALGTAVVAVEPRARWELLYKLVNHAFEHHGDRGDPLYDSGTDLFGLAQSIADRTHGMISIEDDQSHVLAYSASNDEADELRRLSILGRAGPPEHLEWIGQWGIFDALQASGDVVRVAERPELGLRPRLAVGIHLPATDARRPPGFAGTIWLQQGSAPLAGLAGVAAARVEVDRVFDSADRHPGAIGQVTSLDEAHTTVLLDEIVAHVAGHQRLVDPRVRELREQDPMLADTLSAYLDGFGDIAAVAQWLHVHPNTVRYRVRRIEKLLATSLDDPDDRLVLALGLRATEPHQSASAPAASSSNRSMASSPSASRPRSGPASAR
jgi:DNA-binding PucR family transcriptional regulator